ncbi:MFS transporter, partial [Nocardia neocaledoniensis]|uniref:MFS transporter n=1 Tax=Nocardia neocaledoniensis TaxID=236511 RepID=UPI002459120F
MMNRWRLITAFALVGAATQLVWLTYAPVTTVAAEHFGVSEAAVGWLANMFPLLYVVLAVPAGVLLDHWFRPALIAGAVLTALGAALRLLHDGFAVVLLGQTIVAVAQPLVLNAITGIAGHYLDRKDRATGIALGTASTFAGMAAAFVLGAILPAAHQLWTLAALGAGFAGLAAALLTTELLRAERPSESRAPAAALSPASADTATATAGQFATGASPTDFDPAGQADPATGARSAGSAPDDGTGVFGRVRKGTNSPLTVLRATLRDRYVRRLCAAVFLPFGTFVALATYGQALLEPAGVSADAASIALL